MRYNWKDGQKSGAVLQFPLYVADLIRQSLQVRDELSQLNALVKSKEAERDSIELPLVGLLGDQYQSGVLESIYASYTAKINTTERKTLNAENMTRLKEEHPEIYQTLIDEGYITTSVSRSLSVRSKAKKAKTKRKRGA